MWESRVLQRAFERLELHEGKLSRAVLRGGGGGDVTSLPDTWVGNHPGLPGPIIPVTPITPDRRSPSSHLWLWTSSFSTPILWPDESSVQCPLPVRVGRGSGEVARGQRSKTKEMTLGPRRKRFQEPMFASWAASGDQVSSLL